MIIDQIRRIVNQDRHRTATTITDIAKAIGIDRGNLSRFLHGQSGQIGLAAIDRLCQHYHIIATQKCPSPSAKPTN